MAEMSDKSKRDIGYGALALLFKDKLAPVVGFAQRSQMRDISDKLGRAPSWEDVINNVLDYVPKSGKFDDQPTSSQMYRDLMAKRAQDPQIREFRTPSLIDDVSNDPMMFQLYNLYGIGSRIQDSDV